MLDPKQQWVDLLSECEVVGHLALADPESIRWYESTLQFRLPQGYKHFCEVFGRGELADPTGYRIKIPMSESKSRRYDLATFNERVRQEKTEYETYCDEMERFQRAIFFAEDVCDYYYFWDPKEVTDANNYEYRIYAFMCRYQVQYLCSTFWEFIHDVCLGVGPPGRDPSVPIEKVFIADSRS